MWFLSPTLLSVALEYMAHGSIQTLDERQFWKLNNILNVFFNFSLHFWKMEYPRGLQFFFYGYDENDRETTTI